MSEKGALLQETHDFQHCEEEGGEDMRPSDSYYGCCPCHSSLHFMKSIILSQF